MTDRDIDQFLLSADGVNQLQRSLPALDPTTVKIDPRSKRDILRFLYALSEQVWFYDLSDQPRGDWRPFLDAVVAGGDVLDEPRLDALLVSRRDWPPHLALLMAFLQVFSYAQADLNTLPARRLNFYYQDVLRIRRRTAIADRVHVVFELAKNAPATLLRRGTLLKAGLTPSGFPLEYALESDSVVSHARVTRLMSSFADRDASGRRVLFRSPDATRLRGSETRWRPFGSPQLRSSEAISLMEPASPGCAIASPNLFLAEGARTVTLTLRLTSRVSLPPSGFDLRNALDIRLTGEAGWITPDAVLEAELSQELPVDPNPREFRAALTVAAFWGEGAPALVAYDEGVHQASLRTRWPVWSMTLRPGAALLDLLSEFTVGEVQVAVEAKGVRSLVLQNDQAVQPPDGPVLPFGGFPRIGSSFYIGSAEAFTKSITSFAVSLEWQDPPASMASHYSQYENPNLHNASFLSDVYLLAGRKWQQLTQTRRTLFNADTRTTKTIAIGSVALAQPTAYGAYGRRPELAPPASFGRDTPQGFVRLDLVGPAPAEVGNLPGDAPFEAFGHKSFPVVYARHALQMAQGAAGVTLPQPPYTPTLASVRLDYAAADTFRPDDPNGIEQFFQLDVFGAAESGGLATVTLFPRHPQQAALYLGLEKASAPQQISLLVQFEEGSAPGEELLRSEEIAWHYLSGSEWRQISRLDILEDRTDGFQVPGLVSLVLGADATRDHSLMPADLHWLRASVTSRADGAAGVREVHAQAARASLQLPESCEGACRVEFDAHLAAPLPANTIAALRNKVAAVKKVRQPYPSFGGRAAESDAGYHRRVHERLRHRNRAVSGRDHERLILEAFPEIFKVKCLPHTDAANALSPGHVKLVIVPDWRKRSTGDPLSPRANGAFLRAVGDLVREGHTSVFSEVHVSNPVYEALLVDAQVRFGWGFDPGFHAARLEEEIKRFLSPWAYEEGEDIVFGGRVHASEILAFVEGRDYVEYVTNFELYHQARGVPGGGIGEMEIGSDLVVGLTPVPTVGAAGIGKSIGRDFVVGIPVDAVAATRPDAILVSSGRHRIGVLSAEGAVCEGVQVIGIGQMVIGLDFLLVT